MATDRTRLKEALDGVDFPATKEQLLARAESNNADEGTIKALRTVQDVSYHTFADVAGAVPMAPGAEYGQSDSDKAQQNRQSTKDGLAETMTETPDNPIVEELGENRGS